MKHRVFSFVAGTVLAWVSHADADGDPDAGELVFKACKSCHQIGADAKSRTGPHLNNVFGRTAGAVAGFRYSKAMAKAGAEGLIWDQQALDAFLEKPRAYVKGTRMSFKGLKDPGKRGDLIAYLQGATKGPEPALQSEALQALLATEGDAEYGAYLSSECVTCHRADGGDDGIPSVTGWPREEFATALYEYRGKTRNHSAMQLIAGRLGDEEIASLAAFFETLDTN